MKRTHRSMLKPRFSIFRRSAIRLGFLMTVVAIVSWGEKHSPRAMAQEQASSESSDVVKVDMAGLENLVRITPELYSGADPHSEIAFAQLAKLGVRTIISVDGAAPDVAGAKKYGLRYVHIPVGYGGITSEQQLHLIKTVREIPGPIYIHCHHGKHRGPAAAAIAWRGKNPSCTADTAMQYLKLAGTDPKYEGLYAAVRDFQFPPDSATKTLNFSFPEKIQATGVTESMIHIDHAFDNLKSFRESQWIELANHPDLSPTHEALQLLEAFQEMARLPEVAEQPNDYRQFLTTSLDASRELDQALRKPDRSEAAMKGIENAFQTIKAQCAACHKGYRD